jgi:transcriptional regulator NrdR family protein
MMINPRICKKCGGKGRVIRTRRRDANTDHDHFVRRRECQACNWRWNAYETDIDPRRLRPRVPAAKHNI